MHLWPHLNCWWRKKGRPTASFWKCPQGLPYLTFSEAGVVRLQDAQLALWEWTTLSYLSLNTSLPSPPNHCLGLGKGKKLLLLCCFKPCAITSISESDNAVVSGPWNVKACFQVIACPIIWSLSSLTVNCTIGHSAVGIHNHLPETPFPI